MTDSPPALRVVIAEDEAIIRLDLSEMLAEEGYVVVGETGRGDEVFALVERTKPDVVMMDVQMPGLDGISAASLIAEQRLAAVVVLTAFSQRELIQRARDAGVMAYLVKPFQQAELVAAIEVAVSRHTELVSASHKAESLGSQLATRKLVDRAKAKLQDGGMTEQQAFAEIQRRAMDERSTMHSVASAILGEVPILREAPIVRETP
jgi:two-component system, response regulator PdtaR